MPDRPTDIPADTADTAGQAGPTWVGRTERGRAADLAVPERFVAARLLVCDGGVPVGQVELPLTGGRATADEVDRARPRPAVTFRNRRRCPTSRSPS